jgi:hypothetical protein
VRNVSRGAWGGREKELHGHGATGVRRSAARGARVHIAPHAIAAIDHDFLLGDVTRQIGSRKTQTLPISSAVAVRPIGISHSASSFFITRIAPSVRVKLGATECRRVSRLSNALGDAGNGNSAVGEWFMSGYSDRVLYEHGKRCLDQSLNAPKSSAPTAPSIPR